MSVKKLSTLAEIFKKKLAQMSHDPMNGELDIKPEDLPFPIPGPAMPGKAAPVAPKPAPVGAASMLPAELKSLLDRNASNLKGMLLLTPNGNHVKVDYNADRWQGGASSLQKLLARALGPKYTVEEPVGYFNPTWLVNY